MSANKDTPQQSLMHFYSKKGTMKYAADICLSIAGKDAGRVDRSGRLFAPALVAAMKATHLLGHPTSYLLAHECYHSMNRDQVIYWCNAPCACDVSVISHIPCCYPGKMTLVAKLPVLTKELRNFLNAMWWRD
jgi:hypothetical protein